MVDIKENRNYWHLEGYVGGGFNRFKAKLYNLIEASVTDKKQCEAVKGLIKGFANDEYINCIENMRYEARQQKLIPEEVSQSIPPMSAEPLELDS